MELLAKRELPFSDLPLDSFLNKHFFEFSQMNFCLEQHLESDVMLL